MLTIKDESSNTLFYATTLAAGFDIPASVSCTIPPKHWEVVPTGLRIVDCQGVYFMPSDNGPLRCVPELQIRPRSSLSVTYGVTILNAPSTIDADYRGEIRIVLINHGNKPFVIEPGDRIAQGVCQWAVQLDCIKVRQVQRGTGGFGSTGTSYGGPNQEPVP